MLSKSKGWKTTSTTNGWMNRDAALLWLRHFDEKMYEWRNGRYRLLILDGHDSHQYSEFEQYCNETCCIWHIDKNVLANVKKYFTTDEVWKNFYGNWCALYRCTTRTMCDEMLTMLKNDINYGGYAHLKEAIWIPHKEKFVMAWPKRVEHFSHVATSRIEGRHTTMKQWIAISMGDLETV